MERIWLKSYLPGMVTDIDPGSLPSLRHMACAWIRDLGSRRIRFEAERDPQN